MRFLIFKRGSFITWQGTELGYSKGCIITFQDEINEFYNQKLKSPVETVFSKELVNVSFQLLDYMKFKNILTKLNETGILEIQGQLIGKGIETLPVGQIVKFIGYKATLISRGELDFSNLVSPVLKFICLYDEQVNKTWEIVEV